MSTPYALAHLRNSTRMVADFFVKDLKAMPEAALTTPQGGCSRTPLDLAAECARVNGLIATRLEGGTAEPLTEEEKQAYTARFDSRDSAIAIFQQEADRLVAAIDGLDESALGEMTGHPFGHQDTLFSVASIPALHMMYHDGQLNYLQTLHGDSQSHWRD